MKKFTITLLLPALLLLGSFRMLAQDAKKEAIAKTLTDYFFLERENIHAHLNKGVYMTNEKIWFKGYVYHRKKSAPFFTTINVYGALMDESGKVLETKLLYANIGSFSGSFKLSNYKSGKYYIQFYTNWMNNFKEDESAVYQVTVINPVTGSGNAMAKADPSKIKIELAPEGGTLLAGVTNIIGVSVSDCNSEALPVSTVAIMDAAGNVYKTVQVNKLGNGRFDLPANAPQPLKAVVTIEGVKHEQALPTAQNSGLALEVSNFSVADNTLITVRSNKVTVDNAATKPAYLVVHQDEQATVYDLAFDDKFEVKMAVPNTDLFNGMNTIRVLDANLNQVAERLVYKYPEQMLASTLTKGGVNLDNLELNGKVNYPNMNLSVSVLTENTRALDENSDIYSSLLLLPYIDNHKKITGKYYFSTLSKGKMYELDLFLISQKSKYKWHNIKGGAPDSKFPFDMGLTLKGTIPKSAGDTNHAKVRLYALSSAIEESAEVNDKGEFVYNNIVLPDSTYVNFSLLKKGEKPKELTIVPQILNSKRPYYKMYSPPARCYAPEAAPDAVKTPNIFAATIELDEVQIEGKRLKYASVSGNGNLRGYKIEQQEINSYNTLLNFIKFNSSFVVNDNSVNVSIQSTRSATSLNAAPPRPMIYIDNMPLYDLDLLRTIAMNEVDEIYMNPQAIVPSVRNFMGIIRIYLNKNYRPKAKDKLPEIIVKNGFERVTPFENVMYNSTNDEGFENFGVVDWEADIMTDENGAFKLSIPNVGQKTVKLLIEGFSADGKLLSETKVVPVR